MQSSSSSSSKRYVRVQKGEPQVSRQVVQELESGEAVPVFRSRTQVSSRDSEEHSGDIHGGVHTVHTTRVVKHTTTSSHGGENKTVTETFVSSSGGDTGSSVPSSTSVIEYHQTSPDVKAVTRTTTKVVKQGVVGGATATTTTTTTQKSNSENIKRSSSGDSKTSEKFTRKVVGKTSGSDDSRKKVKISDIITGLSDESVTAREALLRWAQHSTEHYPGVRITDFVNSWKDGLAFNAIMHRNKPDLLDFHSLKKHSARENLETAFSLAEKEFGITRLLDPEDVDTPEPDEKSIITYISSMYDVFPDPPLFHPIIDNERLSKVEEYKKLCIRLQIWLQESLHMLQSRVFPHTVPEMKTLLMDCSKFRSEEVPKYLKDKQNLQLLNKEIQKLSREVGQITFEGDLKFEAVEKNWDLVLSAHQKREPAIRAELLRLEKLQRLADKISRETKQHDTKLDDIEKKIKEEIKRFHRLQPVDAKHNCEQIDNSLQNIEDNLQLLQKDIKNLFESNYFPAADLEKRFSNLYQRYTTIRTNFHSEVVSLSGKLQKVEVVSLSGKLQKVEEKKVSKQQIITNDQKNPDTAKLLQNIKEHSEWIEKKMKRIQDVELANDVASIKLILEHHKSDHKAIDNYRRKVEPCLSVKNTLKNTDFSTFEALSTLENDYSNLLDYSTKKLKGLESFLDFANLASKELKWIAEKQEIEINRDWSSKSLNLADLEKYQEALTADLEKHELQLTSIQTKGDILLMQNHLASKYIENYLSQLQSQWSWLLQLVLCLGKHLQYTQDYYQYSKEVRDCENRLKSIEEKLRTSFNRPVNSVDEGEKSLKQMHKLREELSDYNNTIHSLMRCSDNIIPLKQRKQTLSNPVNVISLCGYDQQNVNILKDSHYVLHENSHRIKWKILRDGVEKTVPSVCFVIPPPDPEAIELAANLKKHHDTITLLWTNKERKIRQNLIIATIQIVKSWDVAQFIAMEPSQRESIIQALNDDTQKLLLEDSSNDSNLQKLKSEMTHCNKVFQSLQEKSTSEENKKSFKTTEKKLMDNMGHYQTVLNDKESYLKEKFAQNVRWDVDILENLVLDHKNFEIQLRSLEVEVKDMKELYMSMPKKSSNIKILYDDILSRWDKIWDLSNLYIERLKAVEITLHGFAEASQVVSAIEVQLASFEKMPSDMEAMRKVHDKLMGLQTQILQQQNVIDFASESFENAIKAIQQTRPKQAIHSDLNKFAIDLKKLNVRWENVSTQVLERLRSCGASSELLRLYQNKCSEDKMWITEMNVKVNNLKSVKTMTSKQIEMQVEPVMDLYSSIADRNSCCEHTNLLGARYIREAKIYDLRLKHYRENLEEEHPSLDASSQKNYNLMSGADSIENELDDLNQQYGQLVGMVLQYLEQLKLSFSQSNQYALYKGISEAVPISTKTFRTVIDQAPAPYIMNIDNKNSLMDENFTPHKKKLKLFENEHNISEIKHNEIFIEKYNNNLSSVFPDVKTFGPSLSKEHLIYEYLCDIKGILNTKSAKKLTLYEAVCDGILDFKTCEFSDLKTGEKLSLCEAVKAGYVDSSLYDRISSKCGIFYPGVKEELSLIESINKKLYNLKDGTFINPQDECAVTLTDAFHIGILKKTGLQMVLELGFVKSSNLTLCEAIEKEFLDPKSGMFRNPLSGASMNISEAIEKNYIVMPISNGSDMGITLAEVIDENMYDGLTGKIFDKDCGETITICEAVCRGILRSDVGEIVDAKTLSLHTLNSAIECGLINIQTGKYMNKVENTELTFSEARTKNYIFRPFTLKEALEKNIIKDDGCIINPLNNLNMCLISALANGILDAEAKCIVHPLTHSLISLPLALQQGILTADGKFLIQNGEMSINEAEACGYVTSVYSKTMFDIECIKDTSSGSLFTINDAIANEIIDVQHKAFIDKSSKYKMSLEEAVTQKYIPSQMFNMLFKPIGIKDENGSQLSVIESVEHNILDSKTGLLKDPVTKKVLYLKEAVEKGVITPDGACMLKSLLNISVAMATLTKTIDKTASSSISDAFSEYAMPENFNLQENNYLIKGNVQKSSNHITSKNSSEHVSEKSTAGVNIEFVEESSEFLIDGITTKLSERKTFNENALKNDLKIESSTNANMILCENMSIQGPMFNELEVSNDFKNESPKHAKNYHIDENYVSFMQKVQIPTSSMDNLHLYTDSIKTTHDDSIFSEAEIISTPDCTISNITPERDSFRTSSDITMSTNSSIDGFPDISHETSISVLDLPQSGWTLKEAVKEQLLDGNSGVFTVPGTGRLIPFIETIKLEVIDSNSAYVKDTDSGVLIPLCDALDRGILNSAGNYCNRDEFLNGNITLNDAINEGKIIFSETLNGKCAKTNSFMSQSDNQNINNILIPDLKQNQQLGTTVIENKNGQNLSLDSFVDFRNVNVVSESSIARDDNELVEAKMHNHKFWPSGCIPKYDEITRENRALHRIKQQIVPLELGKELNLISEETIDIIQCVKSIQKDLNTSISIDEAISKNIIDGSKGEITDLKNFKKISIEKALKQGILDSNSCKLLIPIGLSVSLQEAYTQGLIEPKSKLIIHPETGNLTNLHEAIMCDIINPYSMTVHPKTKLPVPIQEIINEGIDFHINIDDLERKTEFMSNICYQKSIILPQNITNFLPKLAPTLPVAIQHNIINLSTQEYVHPFTQKKCSLKEAIESDAILVVPTQPMSNSFTLWEALNKNLIDLSNNTFEHPDIEEPMSIAYALDKGFITIKTAQNQHSLKEFTSDMILDDSTASGISNENLNNFLKNENSFHDTIDKHYNSETESFIDPLTMENVPFETLVQNHVFPHTLINHGEIKTGITVAEALEKKLIDPISGKYIEPKTGNKMPIKDALKLGLLSVAAVPFSALYLGATALKSCMNKDLKISSSSLMQELENSMEISSVPSSESSFQCMSDVNKTTTSTNHSSLKQSEDFVQIQKQLNDSTKNINISISEPIYDSRKHLFHSLNIESNNSIIPENIHDMQKEPYDKHISSESVLSQAEFCAYSQNKNEDCLKNSSLRDHMLISQNFPISDVYSSNSILLIKDEEKSISFVDDMKQSMVSITPEITSLSRSENKPSEQHEISDLPLSTASKTLYANISPHQSESILCGSSSSKATCIPKSFSEKEVSILPSVPICTLLKEDCSPCDSEVNISNNNVIVTGIEVQSITDYITNSLMIQKDTSVDSISGGDSLMKSDVGDSSASSEKFQVLKRLSTEKHFSIETSDAANIKKMSDVSNDGILKEACFTIPDEQMSKKLSPEMHVKFANHPQFIECQSMDSPIVSALKEGSTCKVEHFEEQPPEFLISQCMNIPSTLKNVAQDTSILDTSSFDPVQLSDYTSSPSIQFSSKLTQNFETKEALDPVTKQVLDNSVVGMSDHSNIQKMDAGVLEVQNVSTLESQDSSTKQIPFLATLQAQGTSLSCDSIRHAQDHSTMSIISEDTLSKHISTSWVQATCFSAEHELDSNSKHFHYHPKEILIESTAVEIASENSNKGVPEHNDLHRNVTKSESVGVKNDIFTEIPSYSHQLEITEIFTESHITNAPSMSADLFHVENIPVIESHYKHSEITESAKCSNVTNRFIHSEIGNDLNTEESYPYSKKHLEHQEKYKLDKGLINTDDSYIPLKSGENFSQSAETNLEKNQRKKSNSNSEVTIAEEKNQPCSLDAARKLNDTDIMENYKVCKENMSRILSWIKDIEFRLSQLGLVKEDPSSLQHQISTMKTLKEELMNHQHLVNTCIDQVHQLVQQGFEILNKDDVHALQKELQTVKKRYDLLISECDNLLRRLVSALEELHKFKNELGTFKDWLLNAEKIYKNKNSSLGNLSSLSNNTDLYKDFASDVIAHQADMRFITMAAQKFVDETKDYLKILNIFRINLPQRLSHVEPNESAVKTEVQEITATFLTLLSNVNQLSDYFSVLSSKYQCYKDTHEKTVSWITAMDKSVKKAINEPVNADPSGIQEQLDHIKTLNMEGVGQGRLVENTEQAVKSLIDSLERFQIDSPEAKRIQSLSIDMKTQYTSLMNTISIRIKELQTALIQSQDIQDGLDRLLKWLSELDTSFRNHSKPVSLIPEKLQEQMQEFKLLQSEISNQQQSIETMNLSAKNLMDSNPKSAKKIVVKLKDVDINFKRICEEALKREQLLEEVSTSVKMFENLALQLEEWNTSMIERIGTYDTAHQVDVDGFTSVIEYVLNQRNLKKYDYEQMISIGKSLISKREVTDHTYLKEKLKNLQLLWTNLDDTLNEKQNRSKARTEQLAACDTLRQKVIEWLLKMESSVEKLEPVSLDFAEVKKQLIEMKPLVKEHSEYNTTIEKLNKMGSTYDSMIKGEISHGKSTSPPKRQSSPTKRTSPKIKSPDGFLPSPTKGQVSTQSPLSTTSSGFSSRQSSTDFCGIEDLSPIQVQLSEVNHRYGLLGVKLNDRWQELTGMSNEMKNIKEIMKVLSTFLDNKGRQFPNDDSLPSKEQAENVSKLLKNIQDELIEKQSEMDSFKSQAKQILNQKTDVKGASELHIEVSSIEEKWESLSTNIKRKLAFLEDLQNFQSTFTTLHNWLLQREKLFQVLGPISSDPRIVSSQTQQVQVMKDEFFSQKSVLNNLKQYGNAVMQHLDMNKVNTKKIKDQMETIQKLYDDMNGHLEERDKCLENVCSLAKDFYKLHSQIQDKLHNISDSFDQDSNAGIEEQMKSLLVLEEQLEKQHTLLTDADTLSEQLCEILSDSATKSDVRYKVNSLEKLYTNLQKKIYSRKAEFESCLKEDSDFYKSCDTFQNWLDKMHKIFSLDIVPSSDIKMLTKQTEDFEPQYKAVMDKEHELHLLMSKGTEMTGKLTAKKEITCLKNRFENMQTQYEKLKTSALNRKTDLQSCFENCKKFDSLSASFAPWLNKSLEKLATVEVSTFERTATNKQLKELQSLKNDVSKHIQEYDMIRQLSDALISSCSHDKEKLRKLLSSYQIKWDKLNQDLLLKMQLFEDVSLKVTEYQEMLRDLQHSIQRLEDKISSHDALESVSRDPILLTRVKALHKESVDITKQLENIKEFVRKVLFKISSSADSSVIKKELECIEKKMSSLTKNLENKSSNLSTASKLFTTFTTQIKTIHTEIENLEDTFNKMSPIAREVKLIKIQIAETKEFSARISKVRATFENAEQQCENMTSQGYLPDPITCNNQLTSLQKEIIRLEEHVKVRMETLENILTRIHNYSETCDHTRKQLDVIIKEERNFETVGGDVVSIRNQQQAFKKFRNESVEPMIKVIEECHKLGMGVIQSASVGVSTNEVEENLEKLNELWNNFQERITEREKKMDVALIQLGKFQEAIEGVQKWLKDTENMVLNQKSPSCDYKVVKAQVQEQKFLQKMLLDRQNSVMSLKITGTELMHSTATKREQEHVNHQMSAIIKRFEEISVSADERMKLLEKTALVAQEFQSILNPITEWIEQGEKKLLTLAAIPVEPSHIRKVIIEHKSFHDDITAHKKELDKLKNSSEKLKPLIGKDDVELLEEKVQNIMQKYSEITNTSMNISKELHFAEKNIAVFSEKYEKTVSWIEKTTAHLTKFQTCSVYTDKLHTQVKDIKKLHDSVLKEQTSIETVLSSGQELMKHASGEDTIFIKQKLDTLSIKHQDLRNRIGERLKISEESLPLVKSFYDSVTKLSSWLDSSERSMKTLDSAALTGQQSTIKQMQLEIIEYRVLLETINHTGPKICQLSPGDNASVIEGMMSKINHRFDAFTEVVQRKAERIELAVQRKFDVVGDIDEILDWFKEIEKQVDETVDLSPEPTTLLTLLNERKALYNDICSQKIRVRDILTAAKKVMRESSSEDVSHIREKSEALKVLSANISTVCQDHLSTIEQALPLSQHFFDTHIDLGQWLDTAEGEAEFLEAPAVNTVQIKKQQERNKGLFQSVNEHKPLVDKLNKTGIALSKLCKGEETEKVDLILKSDNNRYNALRQVLRDHQTALEEALQATSQFSDKLEGMLSALTSAADQIQNAEPISAHPDRIQEQINDNKAVLQDLEKRTTALEAVKKAADEVIIKASSIDEPAVKDITKKLDHLNYLWNKIQTAAHNRGKSLEEALIAAEKFWDELTAVMKALKELQDNLNSQESPAVEPNAVQQQQEVLQEIKQDITQTKPEVDHCRQAGQDLMQLCGEPDKPEVKKHIEDLDSAWETITTLYAKREQNLVDAMEKAMTFHETLQNLLEFLDTAEERMSALGAVGTDIEFVKKQVLQLKDFKSDVDPHMIEVESLNRQAQELVERTSQDQVVAIREPLDDINKRWDDLLKWIFDRQQEMENVLLKLGQFQHTLEELVIWITKTENSLDELKPIFGDPYVIEVVLAKHKVLANDIHAHKASIDAVNHAGHQLGDTENTEDVKSTRNKLDSLNIRWQQLQEKSSLRQRELEETLKEALQFHQEIQDLIAWISEIDSQLVTSKPVGGLPETAKDQLSRFMELYTELENNRHNVGNVLQQGQNYYKQSEEGSCKRLQHSLQTLRQKWENVWNKGNDRKIKLEIALREATDFHEALQTFVEWLTNAEKHLTSQKPVSRLMKVVLEQIEDHKNFQKDVGSHREVIINLDKKGTHLKYFSQKQDVILIKNLLISVQHRWERVVSKSAERTRLLDHGYKEAKEFHDAWSSLSNWLDEAEKTLDSITHIANDPVKIKQLLTKHKEFQRILGSKQSSFDTTMRIGRSLKDKCPKQDMQIIHNMLDELKTKWNRICSKSVDRQRKLEEALLYSGQFKEAVQALLDWLDKAISRLSDIKNYHGDVDTVTSLMEQHKVFEEELKHRNSSLDTVRKTAEDLKESASSEDALIISSEVEKLELRWKEIRDLSNEYKGKLNDALKQAEKLHKSVHSLLEWLSEAEMKLRFVGPLPEDEETTKHQITTHEEFLDEMRKQETNKDSILQLAHEILKKCHPDGISIIRHWITIIQSRWEEISVWAQQRKQRLLDHLQTLKNIMNLLEELLTWINKAEATLTSLEAEPLPDDRVILEQLIKEHQLFMDNMTKRQPEIEKITKAFCLKHATNLSLPQALSKEKLNKEKSSRLTSPGPMKVSTPIKHHTESDVKHPKAKLLLEKWKEVWLLAMERQRRLQDKYNYLKELDKIKNFDFSEWRRRYLGWLNNKKSRIMDQFRKIDKDNDGRVTKQEFINGILQSKFSTSHLEMERVADVFDINGDGFIDTKEYLEILRPEKEGGPQTESEKIQDEVQRQVAKCTCVHRFKVYQVGEGKYRFGDSQKLRLVRILRSTVMVRVGGGWVALDEFLVKNDPCRAKGRTNLELREQFILAEGVSQSMTPFKSKQSPNSSVSSQSGTTARSIPSAGPITKIREKSERSTPMHQSRSSVDTSSDISGLSFSEAKSLSTKSGHSHKTSMPLHLGVKNIGKKPSSRPSSRQGSYPSSRAASDLSQDGVDNYKKDQKATSSNNRHSLNSDKSSVPVGSKIPSAKRTTSKSIEIKKKI